jgi:hypothetical protein
LASKVLGTNYGENGRFIINYLPFFSDSDSDSDDDDVVDVGEDEEIEE